MRRTRMKRGLPWAASAWPFCCWPRRSPSSSAALLLLFLSSREHILSVLFCPLLTSDRWAGTPSIWIKRRAAVRVRPLSEKRQVLAPKIKERRSRESSAKLYFIEELTTLSDISQPVLFLLQTLSIRVMVGGGSRLICWHPLIFAQLYIVCISLSLSLSLSWLAPSSSYSIQGNSFMQGPGQGEVEVLLCRVQGEVVV